MNFGKLSKTSVSLILVLMTLAVLIVPALSITYAETLTVQNVLRVQGDYVNGTIIDTIQINQSLPSNSYPIQTEINETVNYDSALYGYRPLGSFLTRWSVLWDDMQTYTGNGTYQMNVNYSQMPYPTYQWRSILVQLDINNSDWVDSDFIRVTTDYGFAPETILIGYQNSNTDVAELTPLPITSSTSLYINTLSIKSDMTSYPTGKIWLAFYVPDSTGVDEQFTFKVESFILAPADALMWDDDQMYMLILLGSVIFMAFTLLFISDPFDIIYDKARKSPKKPRKKSKRKK